MNDPALHRRFIRKASVVYGAMVAPGFTLFFWLPDALALRDAHYQGWWFKLVLGALLVFPLSMLISWLAASVRWAGLGVLIWMAGGSWLAWIGGRVQFDGTSWVARLTDLYPSERIMYPFTPSAAAFTGMAMFAGAGAGLLIGLIGLVALERAWDASTRRYGFSPKSLLWLGTCLPVLLVLGQLADFQISISPRSAVLSAHRLVETVRDPNADLVKAKLTPMKKYGDRLSPQYGIYWNDNTEELTRFTIDIQFDNGLVLRCPVLFDNAYLCSDLSSRLDEWMTQLVTLENLACDNCGLKVTEPVQQWLNQLVPTLGQLESVALLKHQGGWLYMRATFAGDRKIDCRFVGGQPASVDLCAEAH
jgi:hypothetical protein